MGPELMVQLPGAGRCASAPRSAPRRSPGSTSPSRPFRRLGRRPRRRRAHLPGRVGHRLDRRPVADARPARRGAELHRPRRVDLRHLRRLLLPRPRHRRGRRRRLGPRGGHLPHQVRRQGHPRPPPRRAPGLEDHAGAGLRQRRRSSSSGTRGRRASTGDTKLEGITVRRRHHRRASRPRRSPACSWPSATSPTPTCSRASSTWRTTATSSPARRHRHQRRGRVRLRRRPGPHLPPGHHRRRLGLHGRHRRRALARGPGPPLTPVRCRAGNRRRPVPVVPHRITPRRPTPWPTPSTP